MSGAVTPPMRKTTDVALATPQQLAAHNDHKARLQRIAARAVSARRPIAPAPPPPRAEPEAPPAPPAPSTSPWFHIVGLPPKLGRITIEQVKMAVCREFDVRHSNLISQRRNASIVRVRQIGMYLAKELTTRSLPEIGRRFGGRDHTTVLHAVRKVARLVTTDAELAARIKALRIELGDGDA